MGTGLPYVIEISQDLEFFLQILFKILEFFFIYFLKSVRNTRQLAGTCRGGPGHPYRVGEAKIVIARGVSR